MGSRTPSAWAGRSGGCRALIRVLDRQRPARRGALGRRQLVRRRDLVPLRGPDHRPDRARVPEVLRRPLRGPADGDHVRRRGRRRARCRRAVLGRGPDPLASPVGRVDLRAGRDLELHVGARRDVRGPFRRADRAVAAPGHEDPVCGMAVDRGGPTTTAAGRTYIFCGPSCKAAFDAAPGLYAGRA
jgi:YHS domain-containing protein